MDIFLKNLNQGSSHHDPDLYSPEGLSGNFGINLEVIWTIFGQRRGLLECNSRSLEQLKFKRKQFHRVYILPTYKKLASQVVQGQNVHKPKNVHTKKNISSPVFFFIYYTPCCCKPTVDYFIQFLGLIGKGFKY